MSLQWTEAFEGYEGLDNKLRHFQKMMRTSQPGGLGPAQLGNAIHDAIEREQLSWVKPGTKVYLDGYVVGIVVEILHDEIYMKVVDLDKDDEQSQLPTPVVQPDALDIVPLEGKTTLIRCPVGPGWMLSEPGSASTWAVNTLEFVETDVRVGHGKLIVRAGPITSTFEMRDTQAHLIAQRTGLRLMTTIKEGPVHTTYHGFARPPGNHERRFPDTRTREEILRQVVHEKLPKIEKLVQEAEGYITGPQAWITTWDDTSATPLEDFRAAKKMLEESVAFSTNKDEVRLSPTAKLKRQYDPCCWRLWASDTPHGPAVKKLYWHGGQIRRLLVETIDHWVASFRMTLGCALEIEEITGVKMEVINVGSEKDMEKLIAGGEPALKDFFQRNREALGVDQEILDKILGPSDGDVGLISDEEMATIDPTLDPLSCRNGGWRHQWGESTGWKCEDCGLYQSGFGPAAQEDCAECYGTGLRHGIGFPCSKGCTQRDS